MNAGSGEGGPGSVWGARGHTGPLPGAAPPNVPGLPRDPGTLSYRNQRPQQRPVSHGGSTRPTPGAAFDVWLPHSLWRRVGMALALGKLYFHTYLVRVTAAQGRLPHGANELFTKMHLSPPPAAKKQSHWGV